MGEKWRVTVERYEDETEVMAEAWVREIELVASREQLAGFAPGVVADALGASADVESEPETMSYMMPDGPVSMPRATAEPVPKRKRRTKAEITADEVAATLEAQTAAEVAVTNAGPDPYPDAPSVVATFEKASPIPDVPFNPFAPK